MENKIQSKLLKDLYNYLKNDEDILLTYIPKNVNKKFIKRRFILIISLIFIGIFSSCLWGFIFLTHIIFISFYHTIFLFLIFFILSSVGMAGLICLPLYYSMFNKNYVFTSQKIILMQSGKIRFTSYSNINRIDYRNEKKFQIIYIYLSNPMESDDLVNITNLRIPFVPIKMELFDKIEKLIDQFQDDKTV